MHLYDLPVGNNSVNESRKLEHDYERVIGGKIPENFKQVWLITVSIFQGGTANATVKGISIQSGYPGVERQVL